MVYTVLNDPAVSNFSITNPTVNEKSKSRNVPDGNQSLENNFQDNIIVSYEVHYATYSHNKNNN